MASGEVVGKVLAVIPPGTLFAVPGFRAGGSTPAENWPIYSFDASTQWYLDFLVALQGYDGGGLTVVIPWSAASATSGDVVWGVAVRRVQDDAEDVDTSHTYDYNKTTDTCASASGELSYPTVTFTTGADMDSWADGELAMVRVSRFTGDAGDGMTGNAEIMGSIIVKET